MLDHPAVRWLSTNSYVATVDYIGEYTVVRGVTEGTATVIAKSHGLTDSVVVEVFEGFAH
jgi:uncharacterized protein YjdB